jgi:hypothetical protein
VAVFTLLPNDISKMALGMTRDSMVDLQSLVEEKNEAKGADTVSLLTTGLSLSSQQQYRKLSIDQGADPAVDVDNYVVPMTAIEEEEQATRLKDFTGTAGEGDHNSHDRPTSPQGSPMVIGFVDSEEEKKQEGSHSQYAGFAGDYESYNYDDAYSHFQYHQDPRIIIGGKKPFQGGFLCCLFPWLQKNDDAELAEEVKENNSVEEAEFSTVVRDKAPLRRASSSGEEDDVSTGDVSAGSDTLGEKLSEKDRQAVLARLRLAQPDRPSVPTSADSDKENGGVEQKGFLNEIPYNHLAGDDLSDNKSDISTGSGGLKSILKRASLVIKAPEPQADSARRRSLFPTYETTNTKKKRNCNVQFSPMARVVSVKSQKEMTPEEKSSIWWQRWDYEDFRKTGRIITRAMLEGGSEIWLASNQSWRHQGMSKTATLNKAMSLAEESAKNGAKNGCNDTSDVIRSTGDKWWHKFGHSRRGLEHIASIKEGAERQANVRNAIRAVLEEQKRHKAYMREHPEKLRMVSIHHSSWARDLALAAGASDADAVKSNFDEERKSREFYLLKMARSNTISSKGKHVPAFMQPAINTFANQKLDANTSAQIMYRQKQQKLLQQRGKEVPVPPSSTTTTTLPLKRSSMPPLEANRTLELIHDPEPKKEVPKGLDLARRAAGFSHDGAEQVNMAAVLSGMGAVPKSAQPVGA